MHFTIKQTKIRGREGRQTDRKWRE